MTVKELTELLKEMPQDANVCAESCYSGIWLVDEVNVTEEGDVILA